MTEVKTFKNEKLGSIRIIEINDEIWFVGKDVAEALGYVNTRDAISKHVDDEDKGVAKCDTPSGDQDMAIINESGMYSLVLSSKLKQAKEFKHWVTSEVLPTIRKTGKFEIKPLFETTREESKKRDMDYKVLVARMIGALQRYRESLPEKEKNLPVIDGCTLTKFIQDRAKEILPSGIRTDESSLSYVFKNNDDTVDLLAKEVFLGHNLGVESVHSYFGVNSYGDINNRDGYRDPRMVRKSNFIKSL